MGLQKTRAQQLMQSRGRFMEGSMNDRASAVPPVHFLEPEEIAALERPVMAELGDKHQQQHQQQQGTKRGSKLLGQVWQGVRDKLGLWRDADDDKDKAAKKKVDKESNPTEAKKDDAKKDDRPTRDEVYANYHDLVASGFFSSHVIHSSRQPGPRPATSHGPQQPPQWPLAPATPRDAAATTRPSSPVRSPASASSRGTKRAAADDAEEQGTDLDNTMTPKKIRRVSSSRDLVIPKIRKVASRRTLLGGRRSISAAAAGGGSSASNGGSANNITSSGYPSVVREPNKLTKRGGPGRPAAAAAAVAARAPNNTSGRPPVSSRRNVSDGHGAATRTASTSTRVLRPRDGAEPLKPLSVVPDANRGIPSVPVIPAKFTYGIDRENHGPWRGLRR